MDIEYKFSVRYQNKEYSETYSSKSNYDDCEWLNNYNKTELVRKTISWDKVKELNGRHILFGCIESLEQSDNCPQWLKQVDKNKVELAWDYV